ncbi:MAG: hypothetical protein HFE63_07405 [Clostridiales bacterium]|nr:hypothetical protein [Clostridiales bacterium]
MKKAISLSLILSLLLCASACGSGNDKDPDITGDTDGITDTSPVDDGSPFVADSLPALDYGGETVSWFCGDYFNAYWEDIWADDQNGSLVNDSIYKARKNVEERLNIKLEMERYSFPYSEVAAYNNTIKQFVMSGDETYSAFFGYTLVPLIAEGGYFMDLAENKYLDLNKPWWNQSALELMPSDMVPFVTGDATLSLIKHAVCLFFNQDLLDTLQIDVDLYDEVREGRWTLEALEEIIKGSYADLNGDQTYDVNDRYGMTFGDNNKYRIFPSIMAVDMYTKTNDGYDLTFNSERTIDVFTSLQNLLCNNENVRPAKNNTETSAETLDSFGGAKISSIFTSGNSLFTTSIVGDASYILDNSKFKLGMIPFPKYDEEQADYYTAAQRFAHIYIPSTIVGDNFDRAGAVLEAWASECYRSVMPAYFETNLKTRYSSDNDMTEMFDLIRNNLRVEFGVVFSSKLELNCDEFYKIDNNSYQISSQLASKEQKAKSDLEALISALKGEE